MHPNDLDNRPGFLAHVALVDQAEQSVSCLPVSNEDDVSRVAQLNEVIPYVQEDVCRNFFVILNILQGVVRLVRFQASLEIAGDRKRIEKVGIDHAKTLLMCPVEEKDAAVHQVAAFIVGNRAIGNMIFETHVSQIVGEKHNGIVGCVEEVFAPVDLGNSVIIAVLVTKTVLAHLVSVP